MRLIVAFCTVPALFTIGVSLTVRERVIVTLCGILACTVTIAVFFPLLGSARSRGRRSWPVFGGAIASLALIASVVTMHWPLRASYLLSRPALDQLARDVQAGQPLPGPTRVGLFTIKQVEVSRQGIVCLWVDLNPAGKEGLVQCGPAHPPFNLWSMISLDDRWQYIAED